MIYHTAEHNDIYDSGANKAVMMLKDIGVGERTLSVKFSILNRPYLEEPLRKIQQGTSVVYLSKPLTEVR